MQITIQETANILRKSESNIDQERQKLEAHINSQVNDLSLREEFREIHTLFSEINTVDDWEEKAQKSYNFSKIALNLANKYRENYSLEIINEINLLANQVQGTGECYQAVHLINLAVKEENTSTQLQLLTKAYQSYADFADKYWEFYSQEYFRPFEGLVDSMLALKDTNLEVINNVDKSIYDAYKETQNNCIKSIMKALGKVEYKYSKSQIQAHESSDAVPKYKGRTEAEQMEKNQQLMDWLKSRRDAKFSEEEIQEGKERFELLKKIVDEGREEGHKIFS